MTIEATIVADSISPDGHRLTTFQLRYPRFIHSEVMTHRMFSRNASSSRAIPVERMIADLRRDPAMPVYWGAAQKGMQAAEQVGPREQMICEERWIMAMNDAIAHAERLVKFGLHKQIANRILEPWAHINVIVSATSYDNFFELRCHKDAQPEIKALADLMRDLLVSAHPQPLSLGQWHLPLTTADDYDACFEIGGTAEDGWLDILRKVSVARCARVSYLTHDGRKTSVQEDLALADKLIGSVPLHASPAEHQATPDSKVGTDDIEPRPRWQYGHQHGNFTGWRQYRKIIEQQAAPLPLK